jgi:osmoprotectant transport system permease protein
MQPGQPLINFQWIIDHVGAIWTATVQHVELTVIPVVLGFIIALALSIWAARRPIVYGPLVTLGGVLYTIPSLALFAVLIPITGLSLVSAVIPLVTYTILIYVRSIVAGIRGVAPDVIEAAEGMGYTSQQRLTRVELPLAVPLTFAGIRTSTVYVIATATIGGFFGGGGLGDIIANQASYRFTGVLAASIWVAALALIAELVLGFVQYLLTPRGLRAGKGGAPSALTPVTSTA